MAQRRNMRRSPGSLAWGGSESASKRGARSSARRGVPESWLSSGVADLYGKKGINEPWWSVDPKRLIILSGLVVLVCVLVIFIAVSLMNANNHSKTGLERATTEVTVAKATEKVVAHSSSGSAELPGVKGSYIPNSKDVLAIPGSSAVISLDLENGKTTSTGSGAALNKIRSAIATIEETADCGFIFFDVDTGKGLAYNASEEMYVASSAKAPFIYWLLSSKMELDEYDDEEVTWVIEESDNESFDDLFMRYYENGYVDMMKTYNVRHEDYYDDFYPQMSARSLAAVWTDILKYIRSGSKSAKHLASLMEATEVSFIRDGLAGEDVTVMNKAGWIDEEDCSSVTDAAIIETDDRTYIMVIETGQLDYEETEANVSALASALFDARFAL